MNDLISLPPVDPAAAALLFEASLDCVKVLDADGTLMSMNCNGQRTLEIDRFENVCGMAWDTLWPAEAQSRIRTSVDAARAGLTDRFTAFCPTAKGTPKWWDVTVAPVFSADGEVTSILSVSRDITELHVAQREQEALATRLRFVMDSAGIGDWELDLSTGEVRTSQWHAQCFGFHEARRDWNFREYLSYVHPDDRAIVESTVNQTLLTGADCRYEARVVWDNGEVHWIEVIGRVYRAEDGEPDRLLGTVRDITHRKAAELELQQATQEAIRLAGEAQKERQRVDALLDAAPVGIGYADATGRLVLVNAANRAIWGEHPYADSVDEYVEWKGWWADGSDRQGLPLASQDWGLARALRGEDVRNDLIEIEPFGAPGTRKTVLLHASPMRDGGRAITGAVVVQVDITDQIRAQAELRASEAKFRTIADAMPQMVWSSRPDGYHDYYNQQWYDYTGVPAGSTDGEGWNGMFHPADQERAWATWRHSLATGETYEIEYRLRHRSGEYRWVLGRALPVHDDLGRVVRWMGTCTDIHEHRLLREALEERESALRIADRRKDEFLAMLAHELRNPLAPIATAAQLLRVPGIKGQQISQSSQIITRQVRHMTELVDDLLDVSRVTRGLVTLDVATFDIREAVRGAIEQARPLIEGRQHALTTRIPAQPVWVEGDRTRLTQVVANLLNNAAKYTPRGGEIHMEVRVAEQHVELKVCDNGIGIEPGLLPHVFELFTQAERTPDRAQGGLGIGLALVRSLVALHGGTVRVDSEGPGAGSRFTVTLPTTAPALAVIPAETAAPARPYSSLDIVVVDDNVDAAQTLATLLEVLGHRARVFHNADDALARVDEGVADVYILDIGLPGMSGHELARRLRESGPTRHALLIALSGYGGGQARTQSIAAGFDRHFVKPVEPGALLDVLDQACRARQAASATAP